MTKLKYKFDKTSHIPLSRQLAAILKLAIIRGDFMPGDILPTMEALSRESHVSPKVARRALEKLAAEGWTHPVCGVGSVVLERSDGAIANGRLLFYVRQTGYSYYCSAFMSELESRLLESGYKTYVVNATERSETTANRRFENLLKENWALVVVFGSGLSARRLAAESKRPFLLIGDGAPIPPFSAPTCVGRIGFCIGKAVPDFVEACARRGVKNVIQFKYDRGSFDATRALSGAGIRTKTITVRRKSSTENVARAAFEEMTRVLEGGTLPDLFLFTDDILAQGALVALAMAGVKVPEDVAVATHANKGVGPIWPKPLSRLEVDPAANGRAAGDAIVDFFRYWPRKKKVPKLELGSVWKQGKTM